MKVINIQPEENYSNGPGPALSIENWIYSLIDTNPLRVYTEEEIDQLKTLVKIQESCDSLDSIEYMNARLNFLDRLAAKYSICVCELHLESNFEYNSGPEIYNLFTKRFNTRTISPGELILDIDCPVQDSNLGKEIAIKVAANLLEDNKHFSIWYAAGARAPQIRLYFIQELETLPKLTRRKLRELFWKKYVPQKYWKYVDSTMFNDGKTCQLEWAPHCKYNSIFNLILEYVPGPGTIRNNKEAEVQKKLNFKGGHTK